jgi:hypothetical protein
MLNLRGDFMRCIVCDKEFYSVRKNKVFCGYACRDLRNRVWYVKDWRNLSLDEQRLLLKLKDFYS